MSKIIKLNEIRKKFGQSNFEKIVPILVNPNAICYVEPLDMKDPCYAILVEGLEKKGYKSMTAIYLNSTKISSMYVLETLEEIAALINS